MPPKAKPPEQTQQFIIQPDEDASILISTLQSKTPQSKKEKYIPYCTGEALEEFLTACFKAKCYGKQNVVIDMIGGGDLYISNVLAEVTSSEQKIIPSPERAKFDKGETLHPTATSGLMIDLIWLMDHKNNIIRAAKKALGNDASDWNIEIIAPEVNRSKQPFTVDRKTFFKSENPKAKSVLTINFYTWIEKPGLTPQEKSKRLANAITYYDLGRRNFQSNYTKESVTRETVSDFKSTTPDAKSSDIWNEFKTHNLNIFTLPDFKDKDDEENPYRKAEAAKPNKNKDLQFLCLKHKIDHQQFQIDLAQAKQEATDPAHAKTVFENATMAAFSHFSAHENAKPAKSLKAQENSSVFVNELFLANVQVILTEAAFLQKELYPKDKKDSVLQNIEKIGRALGFPIEFRTRYEVPESAVSNESEINKEIDDFLKNFTAAQIRIRGQIFYVEGYYQEGYYNVYLAINALDNILRLYVRFLQMIEPENLNKKTQEIYESYDHKFWSAIESITSTTMRHIAYEEMHETSQRAYLSLLYNIARSYLHIKKATVYSDQNALNSWLDELKKNINFKSNKPESSAAAPKKQQKKTYDESIQKLFLAFTTLAEVKTHNEITEKSNPKEFFLIQAIRRFTYFFANDIGASGTIYSRLRRKAYFEKESPKENATSPISTSDSLAIIPVTSAPVLTRDFTDNIHGAFREICALDYHYNVLLAMDMLCNMLEWYLKTVNTILTADVNEKTQNTFESIDEDFWLDLEAISIKMRQDLTTAESEETSQRAHLDIIYNTAHSYLNTKAVTANDKFSVKSTFSSKDTLASWFDNIQIVQGFKSSKPSTSATPPELPQQEAYCKSIDKAHLAFVSLARSQSNKTETETDTKKSKGYEPLELLHRTTRLLADLVVGSRSTYAARNLMKPYFRKKAPNENATSSMRSNTHDSKHVSFMLSNPVKDETSARITDKLKNSSSNSETDVLADAVTSHTNSVVNLICSASGFYNVYLAMDFLNVALGWYIHTLGTIVIANLEQDKYKKRDEKFWLNIQSIVNCMLPQLKEKENGLTNDIEYLNNLSKIANTYLTSTNVDCNDERNFSLQKTFLSRNALNAWKEKVLEVQKFTSKAQPGTATRPAISQLDSYMLARRNAQHTFTSLAVASNNGLVTFQELRNLTLKFAYCLAGEETPSRFDNTQSQIRMPNYLKNS
ncbi:MAG: hypothetical protein WC748_04885 [Legionellales bacterium]|jgi:hypothetical protein